MAWPTRERASEVQTSWRRARLATALGVRRRRPAEHRRDPRARWSTTPSSCSSTSRARSEPSRSTSRCRSATGSWPRPPTPSCRCRRCSTTGSGPAGWRSAFLGAAQVDRFAQPQLDGHRRVRASQDAASRRGRGSRDRRHAASEVVVIAPHSTAHVRGASGLPHDGRLRRRPRAPRAARAPRPRADRGRSPTSASSSPTPRARADPGPDPRRDGGAGREATGWELRSSTSRAARRSDRRGAGALRELLSR